MSHRWPNESQWSWLRQQTGTDAALTMLNLLRFRVQADYREGPQEAPCSGVDAYKRYSALALPIVAAHGGSIAYSGKPGLTVVGPEDEHWDLMLLVKYPHFGAFIEMAESARYRAIMHHRTAALADSRLLPVFGG